MSKKAILIVGVLILLILSFVFGFNFIKNKIVSEKVKEFKLPPVSVTTVKPQQSQWKSYLSIIGEVESEDSTNITTQISGQVLTVNFKSGQFVNKGDVVVTLDDSLLMAKYKSQKAKLDLAKIELSRKKKLLVGNNVSQNSVDQARTQYNAERASLAYIATQIEFMKIRAPFSGKVGIRTIDVGDYLTPGSFIVELESTDNYFVDMYIPEEYKGKVSVGQNVTFTSGAFEGETYHATVTAIQPSSNSQSHNIEVRALISDEANSLVSGMYVDAEIDLNLPVAVMPIPNIAVNYSLYGDTVFVVGEATKASDNGAATFKVEQRLIKTGPKHDDYVGVVSGLKNGDQIVTSNQQQLKKGSIILINNSKPFPPVTK
ncbi:efflux transporter periplasmic adaptor subunit [Vibrio breoganii]|uniref:efflux RND transporter periplasmic adaptor subunit n=1 Tax=Vibrio breoganii TaxID=553239 RepID=UPI000C86741A|nr:efflux RND transporter periplasmic adaptor subunit [Vibrio breoganii]PMO51495.1 efflux transporter periplasmic adaptor subunit [Vibrio breoganii]